MTARLALVASLALGGLVPAVAQAQRAPVCGPTATTDQLIECATHAVAVYNSDPEAASNDERLYNAAVMFEQAHVLGSAIQLYQLVRKYYPNSPVALDGTLRLGRLFASIAMYDRAAETLEHYAKLYPTDRDAVDALAEAIHYRTAIGDDDKAIEDTRTFASAYGAQRPADAAAAFFALTPIYERRGDAERVAVHLAEYIKFYGERGGTDALVIAYGKLAQVRWDASCPVRPIDGRCADFERSPKPPKCSSASTRQIERVTRNPRGVKDALAAADHARAVVDAAGAAIGADARGYFARTLLIRADADAEKRIAKPGKERDALAVKYEQVVQVKDAATAIIAAERIARLPDAQATAMIDGATTTAACEAAAVDAAPLRQTALRGYEVCLARATELGWFDDTARSCERALFRLAPDRYPALRERLVDGGLVAPVIAIEPVIATAP